MPGKYLSTDPNAGTPLKGGYLSTDPNAGGPTGPIPASEQPPLPEGPTTLGFLRNVLTSGLQFGQGIGQAAQDAAHSAMHPSEFLSGLISLASEPTATGSLLKDALVQRYGSIDAALNSAYRDPVGVAADLSLALGGAGGAAKMAGLTRSARFLSGTAEALNPLSIPAKAADVGGRAVYQAAINPSRRIQRGFPGAVDAGYERNVLPTQGGLARTENAVEESAARTQALLQQADQAGAPGVTQNQIAPSLAGVKTEADRRFQLGRADERGDVTDRAAALYQRNQQPIPLTDANALKQSAQRVADSAFRAQERGAVINDLDALSDQRVAQAYRRAIEVNAARVGVTGVGESNAQTQALIGLAQALEDATQQPSRLTNIIGAATTGGATAAGGPAVGAMTGLAYRGLTSKTGQAVSGLGLGKVVAPISRKAQVARALAFLNSAREVQQGDQEGQ